MASRPDEPPESIILGQFDGLRNTVSRERLTTADLGKALNVDLDDAGQLRRRRGRTLVSAGDFHSLHRFGATVYGVKNSQLGIIRPNYTFEPLALASADPLSYTDVGETLFFSSASVSGKLLDTALLPWGQTGGAGGWISPVVSPTETLGEIAGQLLHAPPLATEITHYKGRIYLASRQWVWATELYLYDLVDRTRNFVPFPDDVIMLRAVEEGIFVGTLGGIYFLRGTLSTGLAQSKISDAVVVKGSAVVMPASRVYPQARDSVPAEGDAVVFLTDQGIMAGFDNGQIFNLTYTRMNFPPAQQAAALYREQDGVNQYLAVTDTGGSPSAQVRIGEYVEAEIRRFQGG